VLEEARIVECGRSARGESRCRIQQCRCKTPRAPARPASARRPVGAPGASDTLLIEFFGVRRRQFLTLVLGLVSLSRPGADAASAERTAPYVADVSLLYDLFSLHLTGTMHERVDPAAGRYTVRIEGQGAGIANRMESSGVLRGGRWAPAQGTSWFDVRGRESKVETAYDYQKRTIEFHARSETFFRRQLRVVDDVVTMPDGQHVDDVVSALLNYAERRWPPEPDGTFRTQVIRRQRGPREGPDDVEGVYRAELVPLVIRVEVDPATARTVGRFDLTRFSSWAREDRPARIVFGPDRRPETITTTLILGTSLTITLRGA
jgi:hypothetical protein